MSAQTIATASNPRNTHLIDEAFSSVLRRVEAGAIVAVDAVLDFLQSQSERQTLLRLDDRELRDIGLTRSAIGQSDAPRCPGN